MRPFQISNPPTKLAEEDVPSPTKNEPFFSHRLVRGQSEGPDPAKRPSEGAVVRLTEPLRIPLRTAIVVIKQAYDASTRVQLWPTCLLPI